jgi:hypothetical protein
MNANKSEPRESSFTKGLDLEERVAAIYRLLGAVSVHRNLRISGHQLDVYAEVSGSDGFITRLGIECKNYKKPLGVNEGMTGAQKLHHLRLSGDIDLPVIVSSSGFTPEAITAAEALGVKTINFTDLLRRVEDFSGYLETTVREYEASRIHRLGLYRSLHCTSESGQDLNLVDEFLPKWFLAGGRFLTLLGDYGTGKTTSAQRIFWQYARAYLSDPSTNRIPLFVPLKRYRKEINIRSLIMDLLLHEYGVRLKDYSAFKDLNSRGRLFIILDAFDEMATGAEESEVLLNFRELKSLVTDESQVLLTCRTHFFKDEDQIRRVHEGTSLYRELDENNQAYKLCFLAPFTRDDIENLVYQYEPARADEYLAVIDSTYNLTELSRHPILLDMILSTVPEALKGTSLGTPSDLYAIYTSFWLDRDDWRTRMTHEQREFFMKELALHFQFSGIAEINFRDLPRYIRQKFPGLRTFRDLDYFEADVRTCTFLVRDTRGNYSFVHRSFAEYFAALCIVDYLLTRHWPNHLYKGRGRRAVEWITPETSKFIIELIDKRQRFGDFVELFFSAKLDGVLLLIILSIYRHSPKAMHRYIFDVAYVLIDFKFFAGVDFRGQIADLARAHRSPDWHRIKIILESSGSQFGNAAQILRKEIEGRMYPHK